jgi:phospho-N-acetylmuramoyl-pentapeptide-transferase
MFYQLLPPLANYPYLGALNVTRYITFRTAAASLTALAISLLLGPWMIRKLRDFQVGQVIRQEGPESHRAKAGTPTMGGLLILASALTPTLLWADLKSPYIWIAVLATVGFGIVGFIDDYLKIVRRSHHGLIPRYKLGGQVLVALGVGASLLVLADQTPTPLYNTRLIFPFFKNLIPDLGFMYLPFAAFILVAWSNAVNLTDGLDGLAISTFGVAAAAFTALAYVTGHARLAAYLDLVRFAGTGELTIFCGALVGASLGFLWYNSFPRGNLHGRRRLARTRRRAGDRVSADQAGTPARDRRRRLRHGSRVGRHSGCVVQVDRQAGLQDGAAPPPLRAQWVERAQNHRPLHHPRHHLCVVQPDDAETAVMRWRRAISRSADGAWSSLVPRAAGSPRQSSSFGEARG